MIMPSGKGQYFKIWDKVSIIGVDLFSRFGGGGVIGVPCEGLFPKLEYHNRILGHLKTIFYGFKRSQISRRRTN